jgi:hypothetical protein
MFVWQYMHDHLILRSIAHCPFFDLERMPVQLVVPLSVFRHSACAVCREPDTNRVSWFIWSTNGTNVRLIIVILKTTTNQLKHQTAQANNLTSNTRGVATLVVALLKHLQAVSFLLSEPSIGVRSQSQSEYTKHQDPV